MRRLIVNGDDFGLHPDVNSGILEAFELGILRSTTLIARGEAAPAGVEEARRVGLDMGVHLTLLDTEPAGDGRGLETIMSGGRFRPSASSSALAAAAAAAAAAVEREWDAQISLAQEMGAAVTHLDSHNHLHLLPTLWPVAVRLARKHSIPALRSGRGGKGPKGRAVALAGWLSRMVAAPASDISSPDRLLGVERSGHLNREAILLMLAQLQDGTSELMVHPAHSTPELARDYPWDYEGTTELRALCHPDVLRSVERLSIELVSYRAFAQA